MKDIGKLFCGENIIRYLTHPVKPSGPVTEDLFGCRHHLGVPHWHKIVALKNGKTKILWGGVINA